MLRRCLRVSLAILLILVIANPKKIRISYLTLSMSETNGLHASLTILHSTKELNVHPHMQLCLFQPQLIESVLNRKTMWEYHCQFKTCYHVMCLIMDAEVDMWTEYLPTEERKVSCLKIALKHQLILSMLQRHVPINKMVKKTNAEMKEIVIELLISVLLSQSLMVLRERSRLEVLLFQRSRSTVTS
jgi:hypothetical protein